MLGSDGSHATGCSPYWTASLRALPAFRRHSWRKNLLFGANALERKRAERLSGNAGGSDEIGRQQERPAKLPAHRFDARRKIDGGPDHREIEPGVATDVAIDDIADMQCQPVFDARQ